MQFPVGSSVIPLFPSGSDAALTLFNNGPSIIYIGSDTALNSNTGFPLAVGSAIVWDKGNPLFIVCAKGYASTLYAVENSGPSSLGTVALSGSVSLAPGSTVGIADGSHVALAPGSEVALADGATVSLTSGTAVTLESGTAVTLADGSTVNLASGATVDIATGATVGLQSGTAVDLASGASVAVNSLPPDTSKYWPCISGESYPPVLGSTSVTYGSIGGNPAITSASGGTTTTLHNAKWNGLGRYGSGGLSKSLVVQGLMYIPSGLGYTSYQSCIYTGFGTGNVTSPATSINGLRLGNVANGTNANFNRAYLDVNQTNANSIDLSSISLTLAQWIAFELVFTTTLTRLTINGDPTLRCTGPAVTDANLNGPFLWGCPDGGNGGNNRTPNGASGSMFGISSLYSAYPNTDPA